MAEQIIQEIYSQVQSKKKILATPPQEDAPSVDIANIRMPTPPSYKVGDKIATRKAYGLALAKLGHASDRIIALDGDTKNSTFSELFKKEHPDRFIECYIAEQNMVSIAVGCATRDRTVPFCSTFAAFFTRAFDQIRMAAISESNINLCGSHCGVSIGEDGPSQMALEDLAMFRSVPMSTVFYPSDGVATEKAVELAANTKGLCLRECSAVAHRAGGPMTAVARPRRRLHGGSSGWPCGAGWNTALVTFGYMADHRPRANIHSVGPWPRTWKFVNPDLGRPGMTRTRSPHSPGPRESLPDGEDSRSQIGTTDWCAHSAPVVRRPERWVRTVLVASRVSSTPDGLLVRFDLPGGEAGVHRRQTSRRRLVGS